jgi:hypothetical protein
MRNTTSLIVALLLGALAVAGRAETILYQDTFDSGSTTLNGTALDVTSGLYGATSGATWSASSSWKVNTTTGVAYINSTSSVDADAWLRLTPQANLVYTLTGTLYGEYLGSTGRYLSLGFAYGSSGLPSTSTVFRSAGKAWMTETSDGSKYKVGTAIATASSWTSGNITYYTTTLNDYTVNTFKIVLDTTGESWQASFYVNDSLYGTSTYASQPNITAVGFGYSGSGYCQVKDFTLTASEIPEPGTFVLLAAGMIGLSAYVWRKRR